MKASSGHILRSPSGVLFWVSDMRRAYQYTLYLSTERAYVVPAAGVSYETITYELIEVCARMRHEPLLADRSLHQHCCIKSIEHLLFNDVKY